MDWRLFIFLVSLGFIHKSSNKKPAKIQPTDTNWENIFEKFSSIGITGNIDKLTDEKNLYTPSGWMRNKIPRSDDPAYKINLAAGFDLIKIDFFQNLQKYTKKLETDYGKRAYSHFKKLNHLS